MTHWHLKELASFSFVFEYSNFLHSLNPLSAGIDNFFYLTYKRADCYTREYELRRSLGSRTIKRSNFLVILCTMYNGTQELNNMNK